MQRERRVGCVGAGGSVSRGIWPLCHVGRRDLDACNPAAVPSLSWFCTPSSVSS